MPSGNNPHWNDGTKIRVLCVDDEFPMRELEKQFLELDPDLRVECVESGTKALKVLENGGFDVVVADYSLSDVNGLNVLKTIRARGDLTPFIMFTSKGREEVVIEALNSGASFYLHRSADAQAQFAELANMIHTSVNTRRTERHLHETSQKLEAIIQASPVPIYAIDNLDRTTLWNRAAERVFGWRAEEVLGRYPPITAEQEEEHRALRERAKKGEELANIEVKTARKDGRTVYAEISAAPVRDREGKVIATIGVAMDLTERKHMENGLRRVNRLYALLSEANLAVIGAKDRYELFKDICRTAVERGSFRMAWVGLVGDDGKRVHPVASFGTTEDHLENIKITLDEEPHGKGATGTAIREGRVVLSRDILTDPAMEPWRAHAIKHGYKSSASIPLRTDGEVIGSLNLYDSESDFFSEEHKTVLEEISSDISYALDSIKAEDARRMAYIALEREAESTTKILDTTGALIVVINRDGVVVRLNKEAERITGFNAQEVIGKSLWDTVIPPELVDQLKRVFAEIVAGNFPKELENEWLTKNGSRRLIRYKNTALVDGQGVVRHIIGTGIDVTEERKIEEALRQNEAKLRLITENQMDMITQLDLFGNYVYASESHKAVLGYDPEYLVGKSLLDFVHPADAVGILQKLTKAPDGSGVYTGRTEFRARRADGTYIWVEATGKAISGEDGKATGGVVSTRDISIRKLAEENLKQRTEEAEVARTRAQTYLDFMSHDIMNIITPLTTYAQMISENEDNPSDTKKYASRIDDQIKRLSSFVDNVRRLSRTEAESPIGFKAADFREVLRRAEEEVVRNHRHKKVVVHSTLPEGPVLVPGEGYIEDIVTQILDNSTKHTNTKEVVIDIVVRSAPWMGGNPGWIMEFADHGPGIPDEEKKLLLAESFEPSSATLRGVATRLAFMSLMVAHLGGHMKIEDVVKGDHTKGTKIVVRLPQATTPDRV